MSVAIDADVEVRAGVALVTVRIRNPTPVARLVRVANRLDGPVLPPRRQGVPEAGWDGDGVTAVVDAEGTAALGYACSLADRDPVDPPAVLVDVGDLCGGGGDLDEGASDGDVVARVRRDLGGHRPPRDAVPLDGPGPGHRDTTDADRVGSDRANPAGADTSNPSSPAVMPGSTASAVDDCLARAAERVALAERLTGASVAEATAALATSDLSPAALVDAVGDDVEALRVLEERVSTEAGRISAEDGRASALVARAEATDVPVDALRRLA